MSTPVPINITGLFVAATLHIQGQIESTVQDDEKRKQVQIFEISEEKSKQLHSFSVWSRYHKL